jgi:hypothetical protein
MKCHQWLVVLHKLKLSFAIPNFLSPLSLMLHETSKQKFGLLFIQMFVFSLFPFPGIPELPIPIITFVKNGKLPIQQKVGYVHFITQGAGMKQE